MNDLPLVTVVMPVRNEGPFLAPCLEAVLSQDYPGQLLEVIVADGMSTDATRDIIRQFQSRHATVELIDNPGRIVPTGLNAAIQRARGEIIVRVDGHCVIAPDYVRRCVEHLRNDGVDGVGGPVETVGETGLARVIAVAMGSTFGVGGSAFRTVHDRTTLADTIPFPAYTRAVILRAGPYDEELVRNQDDEYNYRLRKMGARLLLAADVRSVYYSRSSWRALWRQYFDYGYWKIRVMQKHPRQMRPRQFAPALLVGGLLLSLALSPWVTASFWILVTLAGAYLVANACASWATAGRQWSLLARLPLTFAILHFSYGGGFLVGLAHFWNRWGDGQTRVHPPEPQVSP